MNIGIRVATVGGNRLVRDYVAGDDALAGFFPGHPFDPEAYRRKADEVRRRFDDDALRAMAAAVRTSSAAAAAKLERIASGDGFFVTTGQQPGLFGGPLYTVHKALTAIALARHLEGLLEAPVLALFWVASDDHDWAEANHAHLLDTANEVHRIELTGDPDSRRSMGRRPLEGGAETALDQLTQILPPSDFTPPLLERLRAAYSSGTVASAFAGTLDGVLQGLEIGYVDAQDPVVRERGAAVLRRDLETREASESALRRQTERLEGAGYPVQVPVLESGSNVFYEDEEHGRERLFREGGGWVLRASRESWTEAELWERFESSPDRFSANVVLRPVVESAVFPTLAYVGGPGEVSYLTQTGCLFEHHGVGMPVVFPRLGVTLVESKVEKVLEKFGLEVESFSRPTHELIGDVVREDVPEAVESAVGRVRGAIGESYQALFEAARDVDPTLKGPIFNARNEAFQSVSEVEKKIRQHVKLKKETELEQVAKAATNLYPQGKPQERVLNVHQYLARYGPELVPAILDRMEIRLEGGPTGWTGVDC